MTHTFDSARFLNVELMNKLIFHDPMMVVLSSTLGSNFWFCLTAIDKIVDFENDDSNFAMQFLRSHSINGVLQMINLQPLKLWKVLLYLNGEGSSYKTRILYLIIVFQIP